MNVQAIQQSSTAYPEKLRAIPSPPQQLYSRGTDISSMLRRPSVAIVGSRRVTAYGRQVTTQLAESLAAQGIIIVSGLAFGVDSIAHQAALRAQGLTIAVLPGPVEHVYPRSHQQLSEQIIMSGGALVSEYQAGMPGFKQNFIARNRIVAGLCDALLITEAAEKSGSLHTARFALEQGKTVLAVPGNITSPQSVGTNNLIKAGAIPVTDYSDVLFALGLQNHTIPAHQVKGRTAHEQGIIDLLLQGVSDGNELLLRSGLAISAFNQALTMLEVSGKIRSLGANAWAIY